MNSAALGFPNQLHIMALHHFSMEISICIRVSQISKNLGMTKLGRNYGAIIHKSIPKQLQFKAMESLKGTLYQIL